MGNRRRKTTTQLEFSKVATPALPEASPKESLCWISAVIWCIPLSSSKFVMQNNNLNPWCSKRGKNMFPAPKKPTGSWEIIWSSTWSGWKCCCPWQGYNEMGFQVLSNQPKILLNRLLINLPATFTQLQTVIPPSHAEFLYWCLGQKQRWPD